MTISIEEIRSLLEYLPESGLLIWRPRSNNTFNAKHAGRAAGSIFIPRTSRTKYLKVHIQGGFYLAHRLVYAHRHGFFPGIIDHIDGNGLNNRIENLRAASFAENAQNRPLQKNSSTGVSGVFFDKRRNKFRAYISCCGEQIYLGIFDQLEDAKKNRADAEARLGFSARQGVPA